MLSTKKLISFFMDNSDIIELRRIHPDRKGYYPKSSWVKFGEMGREIEALQEDNKNGYGIYYGLLPRSSDGGRKDEDCMPGRVIWADFDGVGCQEAKTLAEERGFLPASAVVNSGHGCHLYWFISEPQEPARIADLVRAYAKDLGSDPSVANPSRIFRLPGFINTKEPRELSEIIELDGFSYEMADLERVAKKPAIIAESPLVPFKADFSDFGKNAVRAATYCDKIAGSGAGGRTAALYRVAAVCSNDFSLNDSEALEIMLSFDARKNSPPIQSDNDYPKDEIARILANAKRYKKKPSGTKAIISMPKSEPIKIKKGAKSDGVESDLQRRQRLKRDGTLGVIKFDNFKRLISRSSLGRRGQYCVVAGPEGEGKSIFAMNLCLSAYFSGEKFAYLPLEDTRAEWQERALAILSRDWSPVNTDQKSVDRTDFLIKQYDEVIQQLSENVYENPMKVDIDDIDKEVELVTPESVLDWVKEVREKADVIVIDCLSQIVFNSREQHRGEGEFVIKLEALAKGKLIILVCHTRRRDSRERKANPHSDDVQGSKMIMRRAHVGFILITHNEKSSSVFRHGGCRESVDHERTVFITKARNGDGKNTAYAYTMGDGGQFSEIGTIDNSE